MPKIAFTKLSLTQPKEVKQWEFNGQIIEVKQYLPIKDRTELAQNVVQQVLEQNDTYLNEFAFRIFMDLEIVFNYTNLSFTEKQKEDLYKLYDLLSSSGFIRGLRREVECHQLDELEVYTYESLSNYFKYRNSIYGIMDNMSKDYGSLATDAETLRNSLTDSESLKLLKDTLTNLG